MHGRGAKTLDLRNYRLTTVSGIPGLNSFLSCDARNVKYLFFKSAQKVGPKLVLDQMNLQGPGQLWPFFEQFFWNRIFEVSLLSGMCPTLICHSVKSIIIRTHVRTHGRTDGTSNFAHPTDVKSASRKKTFWKYKNRWWNFRISKEMEK